MKNEIKRHFYNGKHYKINKINKTLELLPEFHKTLKNKKLWNKFGFKKITGSSIGDVLLVDQYKSQFLAFCRMSWISMPILDRKYVDAGIAIEPKVISAIEEMSKKKIETYAPEEYEFDFFKDKDDIFGGLPDGYIKEDNMIIEIKTSKKKNLEKWKNNGIPESYHKQTQLYSYLMGANHYSIVATFLEEEDYLNPEEFPIRKRIIKNWIFKLNEKQIMDDMDKAKKWYIKHITTGISPKYDSVLDLEILEWLEPSNKEEWLILKDKWIKEGKII